MSKHSYKTAFILSGSTQEATEDKFTSKNIKYKRRHIKSGLDNWLQIIQEVRQYRMTDNLVAIMMYLTEETLFNTCNNGYLEWWPTLLNEMQQVPSLIFVYEDNLKGIFSRIDDIEEEMEKIKSDNRILMFKTEEENAALKREKLEHASAKLDRLNDSVDNIFKVFDLIFASNVEIVPYKKRAERNVRAQEFIDEIDSGIFLRLYVPNGRLASDQFGDWLKLFEGYLQQAEGRDVFIESRKTKNGIIYIFREKDALIDAEQLELAKGNFEGFLNMVQSNPRQAESTLTSMGMNSSTAIDFVAKYAKECRRVTRDLKYETERRWIAIRERCEEELDDILTGDNLLLTSPEGSNPLLSIMNTSGPITINYTNVTAEQGAVIQSIIAQEVNGNIAYTPEDNRLIELFDKYADKLQSLQLKSELDQLKDDSMPEDQRKTSKQKILSFLYKFGKYMGDNAMQVLIAYIEKKALGL